MFSFFVSNNFLVPCVSLRRKKPNGSCIVGKYCKGDKFLIEIGIPPNIEKPGVFCAFLLESWIIKMTTISLQGFLSTRSR